MAPLESPLTRVEEDLRGEAVELFIMVDSIFTHESSLLSFTNSYKIQLVSGTKKI